MNIKDRIIHGWTFIRVLYLVLGLLITTQAIIYQQWPLIIAGCYFAAMGLFRFGCAAGNCFGESCNYTLEKAAEDKTDDKIK